MSSILPPLISKWLHRKNFEGRRSPPNVSAPKKTKPRSTRARGKPIATHFFGYVLEDAFLYKYAKERQCEVYKSEGGRSRQPGSGRMKHPEERSYFCEARMSQRQQAGGLVLCLHIATEERAWRLKAAVGVDEDPQWNPIIYGP
ncbi:hypothetical protein BV22DRAFT_1046013 [Leucogyrophana mollusca]|uniref:Uncharacterized protein n=1 Tax=Leucogyrophana mollusca TaxID=85980 RepID=A0ACB8BM13_9AGAM|nr:hypothetical protein BV22DRAFT_1046013 [Leucogyrophana mollusca]